MQNLGAHLSKPLRREVCDGAKLTVYCNGMLGVECALNFREPERPGEPAAPGPEMPRGALGVEVMFAPVSDD